MTFTWPMAFLLALAVPVLLAVYVVSLRRRRQAVTYSSVALLRAVLPRRSRWKRHVPVALLVASLGLLSVGAARPQLSRTVSSSHTSVILALDVSRSMCATDVDPNRLTVAQQAAKDFVAHEPAGTRTGLIIFAGLAQEAVPPTTDRKAITRAIDGLSTGLGTAIGSAMLKSLDAIAEVNPAVKPVGDVSTSPANTPAANTPPPGSHGYVPDIVVLLTDGANNRGIAPLDAVPYAVERRVRVYTIGFGTTHFAPLSCTVAQLGGDAEGGFFGGGFAGGNYGGLGGFGGFGFNGRSPLLADLPTLKQVAERTGGVAYTAQSASQLHNVFVGLPKDVTVQKEHHEITSTFVGLGLLLAVAAIAASLRWSAFP
jgi:Ca-activated chloride channel family protein